MSTLIGNKIKLQVFGESHGKAIGAVIDGLPAGFRPDTDKLDAFLERRRPGKNRWSTPRKEADVPKVLSGILDGSLNGSPLCVMFENGDTRSSDYADFSRFPRPGHSDFTSTIKYHGYADMRGGGHFSGRLTAPLVFAGAIAVQILEQRGITVGSHLVRVGDICDRGFDPVNLTSDELLSATKKHFPTLDDTAGEKMIAEIEKASSELDSVGGIVECGVLGLSAGLGGPLFDGIEGLISRAIFGIPAIKGIEFGSGFEAGKSRGSQNNDPFTVKDGKVLTETNNAGGILGGITSGMPLIFRAAVKPTPSISQAQQTADLEKGEIANLEIKGRHDPCIAPRCTVCIEAVTALVILDILENQGEV